VLLVSIVAATCPAAYSVEPGAAAGPVKLTALSGETIVMQNYAERPATAVLFFSPRCPATERSIQQINAIHRKHRRRDALFVGVCSSAEVSADELRDYAQRRGMIFPVYQDSKAEVAKQFAARVTPEAFLIDRAGKLVFHGGLTDASALQALDNAIDELIQRKPVAQATAPLDGTPLDRQSPAQPIADPFATIDFASELVFERIPNAPAHHCSTLCEAANGDLLCLWYGGSYESADDQVLFLARKKPGERRWGEPRVVQRNALQPPGNGVIFRDTTDRLWIVWGRMDGTRPMRRGSGWDRCRLFVRTSTDHGVTWSDDRPMIGETMWCVPRNPPARMADGTLVLGVEGEENAIEGSRFLILAPGSDVWQLGGFTGGGSQPAVVQRSDGSLLSLMRHPRFITQIESNDTGRSWSPAKTTELHNPDSGITMTRLANGHLLLVYNDTQTSRTPLSIARSVDEGRSWDKPLHLESNPGEYSYPCIIQSADGRIHISYTYRRYSIMHVMLNEDWLVHLERPN